MKDSKFSQFFRNATDDEKRRIYSNVLKSVERTQIETLKKAAIKESQNG